jgi:hypothetical protein
MDALTDYDATHEPSMYIVEMTRNDVIDLVHAAYMHAEGLNAEESKRLKESAKRLSDQAVYFN